MVHPGFMAYPERAICLFISLAYDQCQSTHGDSPLDAADCSDLRQDGNQLQEVIICAFKYGSNMQ